MIHGATFDLYAEISIGFLSTNFIKQSKSMAINEFKKM